MNNTIALVAAYSIAFEGCISLLFSSSSSRKRNGKLYAHFTPYISICGTNKELLESFCRLVSYGKVSNAQKSKAKEHNVSYRWELYRQQEVKSFCEEILPYLLAKKKQAELLIEYCGRRLNSPHPHSKEGYKFTYTPRETEIWLEMKKLNQRGVR